MNTYVELKGFDNKFDTIDDAIQFAEDKQLETAEIFVFSEDGDILESQECERNPHSGDLVYYTWGVFGYTFYEENAEIESSDILAEDINSEEEAREIADTLKEKFGRYNKVTIAHCGTTLSEYTGDTDEEFEIYGQEE